MMLSLEGAVGGEYQQQGERTATDKTADGRGDGPAERAALDYRNPMAPEPWETDTATVRARVEAFKREWIRDIYEARNLDDREQRMIEKGFAGQESMRPGSPADRFNRDVRWLQKQGDVQWLESHGFVVTDKEPAERKAHDRSAPAPEPSPTDIGGRANFGHEDIRRSSRRGLDPRLDRVRQTINHLDQRIQLERAHDGAVDDRARAYVRLIHPAAERVQTHQASAQFRAALAQVYRDPMAARRAFYARAEQMGDSAAAADMGRRPERFGQLRGVQFGPVRSAERAAARQAARKLEHLGNEHVRRVREAWANRAEYGVARATVVRLERQIKTLYGELERGPGRAHLEQRLARQIQDLQPSQRRTLQRSLPIPHRKLLAASTMLGREFAQEQGHER